MILSLIIVGLIIAIMVLLFLLTRRNNVNKIKENSIENNDNKTNKSHCYTFSIEGDDMGIYVLSSNKMNNDELEEHKIHILNKLYDNNIPDNIVVGIVYMGLIDTEDK